MKLREPGSLLDGIMQTVALLGDEKVQAVTGRSAAHVRACSDPDSDRRLMLHDALALDTACARLFGVAPIAQAYHLQLTRAAGVCGVGEIGLSPVERIALLTESMGDIARVVRAAFRDGQVSPGERHSMEAAIANHEKWLGDLRKVVSAGPGKRGKR